MSKLLFATSFLLACVTAYGAPRRKPKKPATPPVEATPTPGFSVDPSLKDKVFEESLKTSDPQEETNVIGSVGVELRVLHPINFKTENRYYAIDYAKAFPWLPLFSLSYEHPLWETSDVSFGLVPSAGYFYGYRVTEVHSLLADIDARDEITTSGLPLGLGLKGTTGQGEILPFGEVGLKYLWLQQSGSLDGLSQTFWLPGAYLSLGATFQNEPRNLIGQYNVSAAYEVYRQQGAMQHAVSLGVGVQFNVYR